MTRMFSRILVALLALGARVALADKLSDFQEAVKKDGCKSIPYSDYRSTCESQQSPVHEWCDGGRGPVTCVSEGVTRQLKDALARQLRDMYEAGKPGHEKQITARQNALDTCKGSRP